MSTEISDTDRVNFLETFRDRVLWIGNQCYSRKSYGMPLYKDKTIRKAIDRQIKVDRNEYTEQTTL